MQRRSRAASTPVAALVLALVLAGCGSSNDSATAAGTPVAVHIRGYAFDPQKVQLKAGQPVTFVVDNADKVEHNLTIDGLKVNQDVAGGKTARAAATPAAGTYSFHCEYHPQQMTGTVTVT